MNLTTLMQIGDNINQDSSLVDRAIVGGQVVAIGMGVVFGVLVLLICVLQVFKIFANEKPAQKEIKAPAASAPASAPAPVSSATVSAAPASEEATIVAIATAAIAASRGESECAFKVLSIKKIVK